MTDAETKIERRRGTSDLDSHLELCQKRLYSAHHVGYRDFIVKTHSKSLLHNFLKGIASVGICRAAPTHGVYIALPEDNDAIADDWYMIGNDICSAIVTFDCQENRHGRSATWCPEPPARTSSKAR